MAGVVMGVVMLVIGNLADLLLAGRSAHSFGRSFSGSNRTASQGLSVGSSCSVFSSGNRIGIVCASCFLLSARCSNTCLVWCLAGLGCVVLVSYCVYNLS